MVQRTGDEYGYIPGLSKLQLGLVEEWANDYPEVGNHFHRQHKWFESALLRVSNRSSHLGRIDHQYHPPEQQYHWKSDRHCRSYRLH